MSALVEKISSFTQQWLGTALPSLFILFLGILLFILVVTAVWDRRIKLLGASFGLGLGLLFLVPVFGGSIVSFWAGLDGTVRIRLVAVFVSLAMLLLTCCYVLKTGLHARYGLLWGTVSLLVLLTALFPGPLQAFPSILGMQYGLALATLGILFLLFLVFHLSVVISELQNRQACLLDRLGVLEQSVFSAEKNQIPDVTVENHTYQNRFFPWLPAHDFLRSFSLKISHGTAITAPIIIVLAVGAVVLVGMLAPRVMIGDEVTHYYMMETQSRNLLAPNFLAEIPTGWGATEVRRYPHPFLWHYFGAVLFYLSGGSFLVIQLYQATFLAQLLVVAYLLARSRGGVKTRSALVYLLLIVSLPMTLIFSVAFYQDVPMTAQILTAFYLLRKQRWFLASLFLCFALGLKVTAILFFPAFFLCLMFWTYKRETLVKTVLVLVCSLILVGGFTIGFSKIMKEYGEAPFYPVVKMEQLSKQVTRYFSRGKQVSVSGEMSNSSERNQAQVNPVVSEQVAEIIANHPGDLRIKTNFFVYGGLLLYLGLGCTVVTIVWQFCGRPCPHLPTESPLWLWATGLSYIGIVYWFLRTAPDARFFFPGLVFCMMPIAERIVCLPWPRWIVMVITTLALMQSGYALSKTYHLRKISPDTEEAIHYLQNHIPRPHTVFMYPEGNYRLFPVPHEWYLNYYLRDFWRANNDVRIQMLRNHGIGAIVIKKQLISPVDEEITNLGVYPDWFVDDLSKDNRFKKLFENSGIVIYQVPY